MSDIQTSLPIKITDPTVTDVVEISTVSGAKALKVDVIKKTTEKLEDAAHTTGDTGEFILGVRNDGATALTSADGDYSPFATDSAGRIGISDLGGSITVDGTLSATFNAEKVEDAVHASGDTGAFVLGVRNDTGASLTSADGDYTAFATDAAGRVGIADLGGSVSVDDGGGSITVDGIVATNSEKSEDSSHASGATGNFVLGVRNETAATLTSTDGDYTALATDAAGRVGIADLGGSISIDDNGTTVSIDDGGGSITVDGTVTATLNVEKVEDAVHASGDTGAFVLGVRNDGATALTSADGDYSPIATDSAGRVGIADLGGSVSVDDNGGSITVDGTVATNAEKVEDAAHASGATGNFVLGVRNDTATALTSADGDYSPLATDSAGRVGIADLGGSISIDDNGTTVSIDDGGGSITVDGTVTAIAGAEKAEDAAHASGATGNFVLAVRNDTQATVTSTDSDYSQISVDKSGQIFTVDAGREDGIVTYYNTVSSVANNSTGTITYTTTAGKVFYLRQILAASSGAPAKVVVDYGAGPTTVAVAFYSTAKPLIDIVFAQPIRIAASTAVNVKITNLAGAAQDVYATIMGYEV